MRQQLQRKMGQAMAAVTDEQIEKARSIDLLSYLQLNEPGNLRDCRNGEYCLEDHDSLKISNGKWFWFSRDIGSNNALDFLIEVRGMEFTSAVEKLADGIISTLPLQKARSPPKSRNPKYLFALPTPNSNHHRAAAYLIGRGIHPDIIDLCIQNYSLYESRKYHNCVFVGFEKENPRFACLQGTRDKFKQDVAGSDKRFSFVFPASECGKILNVFEAPIDALSFATMERENSYTWRQEHYLSLGGLSSKALMEYLDAHPEIVDIRLRLDNDAPGLNAMKRIRLELAENPRHCKKQIMAEPSPFGKDWNDLLMNRNKEKKEVWKSISKYTHITL